MATLDWYGCATFRLRTGGLTVFLDAYIDRAPDAAGTGLTADDVDECDWIVIGHAHFDHLYGAERILARTNATLIGSYETVRVMEAAGVPADRMICVAGGERVRLSRRRHRLGAARASTAACGRTPRWRQSGDACLGDLGVTWQEQQERMRGLQSYLRTALAPGAVRAHAGVVRRAQPPRRRRRAAVPLRDARGLAAVPGHVGALDRHPRRRCTPTSPSWPPPAGATSTASRSRGRWPTSSGARSAPCGPGGCCSATTTTGCPGFSVATDMGPLRAAIGAASPGTELLEPGYLAGTDVFAGR